MIIEGSYMMLRMSASAAMMGSDEPGHDWVLGRYASVGYCSTRI